MNLRTPAIAIAMLLASAPLAAQERGTVEFGAFAGGTAWDDGLFMNNGWTGGARVGLSVAPRLAAEFEVGADRSAATTSLRGARAEVLTLRLTAVPLKVGRTSLLLGAGVDHTDTRMLESFGLQALAGAKFALTEALSLRADAIGSYMLDGEFWNPGFHVGMSYYVNARPRPSITPRTPTLSTMPQRSDSVSAAETARLRADAARYEALRDSLARVATGPAPSRPSSSDQALVTMQEMIYFANDRSELSDSAEATLRDKVTIFRSNPDMRIVIVGFASQPGTPAYNMALGLRRAEAAKAYLITQGVDPIRIEIATRGEGELLVDGPGETADAANRRGQFRLQVADPYLVGP